jgi:hypothetical protein
VQPHCTTLGLQVTGMHWALLQIWPQPHAGVHTLPGHSPLVQVPAAPHPQVPPQPSPPPQVPSVGQLGLQQLPPYSTEPLAQAQVRPQPSGMPARLPLAGQLAAQQAPM